MAMDLIEIGMESGKLEQIVPDDFDLVRLESDAGSFFTTQQFDKNKDGNLDETERARMVRYQQIYDVAMESAGEKEGEMLERQTEDN